MHVLWYQSTSVLLPIVYFDWLLNCSSLCLMLLFTFFSIYVFLAVKAESFILSCKLKTFCFGFRIDFSSVELLAASNQTLLACCCYRHSEPHK